MTVPNMMDTAEEIAELEAALLGVIRGYEERTGRRIKSLQVVSDPAHDVDRRYVDDHQANHDVICHYIASSYNRLRSLSLHASLGLVPRPVVLLLRSCHPVPL